VFGRGLADPGPLLPCRCMTIGLSLTMFALGLGLSAFFSSSETALTALPLSRVVARAEVGSRPMRWAWSRWRTRPHRLIVTLLIGNTLVNIGLSAVATELALELWGDRGLAYAVGVTTFVVLVFGEVTPKTLARVDPEALGRLVIFPIAAMDWLLAPFTAALLGLSHLAAKLRRKPLHAAVAATSVEDVRFTLSLAREEGHVTEFQHGVLEAVLRFEGTTVRQVQIPRTDVVFLADTLSLAEVEERVLGSGYSRFPVFHGRDDNVIGMLLAKDLLRPEARREDWRRVLQPALFVPETKRVVELLREMRDRRVHVALTVDEYGAIAGLVSLEDLIEMIVGDIQDEFDTAQPSWVVAEAGEWLVRGSLSLERLAQLTHKPLAAGADFTSVAGLLLDIAGRVPAVGERFEAGGLVFEVTTATPARIEQVRVTIAPSPTE